jgi:transcriptional regulator GlxA family with amidase domain
MNPLQTTFLILPESSMLTVASALEPLRAANRFSRGQAFAWSLRSLSGAPVPLTCGYDFPVDGKFDATTRGDLLIIAGGFRHHVHGTAPVLRQLRTAWPNYDVVMALEAASWYLARAELVRAEPVTTHWEDLEDFQAAFPEADTRTDRFTIGQKLFCAGGASPAFDLMLYQIQQKLGYSLAMQVAGAFIYDQARGPAESQVNVPPGRLADVDGRVARAIGLMEQLIDQPISTAAIARRVGLSPRGFEYAFKRTIGWSPGAYFLDLRLQTAARLVRDTGLSLQQVAIRSGFGSQSAFARCFRQKFSASPSDFRRQANS